MRVQPSRVDPDVLDQTAATLVGEAGQRKPRNIIAIGRRGLIDEAGDGNISDIILELAEALNAPVLTRLHAKGAVDESHPLAFGVIGVHGKPGLEAAATLISSSDRVISIGVDDETLLVCNVAGLQIRKVVEIEPDAMGLSTRFEAEHTVVGNVAEACRELTIRVETLTTKRNKKEAIGNIQTSTSENMELEKLVENFGYMMHNNPEAREIATPSHTRRLSLPILEEKPEDIVKDANQLWLTFQQGNWRKIATMQQELKFKCDYGLHSKEFCHPAAVLDALSKLRREDSTDAVSKDAAIAVDVGDVTLWASLCLNLTGGSRTLYSERLGTMGYALCAGIAAVLAKPEPAGGVVLAGDGGFQMSLQELSTFQQMKRPGDKLLCIVFDNQVLGRVAFGFDDAKGCEMMGPDYVALAKAYGGDGVRLDSSADAEKVMKHAMEAEGLFLIHVIVDPEVKADMAAFHDNSLKVMNSG